MVITDEIRQAYRNAHELLTIYVSKLRELEKLLNTEFGDEIPPVYETVEEFVDALDLDDEEECEGR